MFKNTLAYTLFILQLFIFGNSSAQKNQYLEYNTSTGLPDDYIYNIEQDSMGFIWAASGSGLIKLDDKHSEIIKQPNGESQLIHDFEILNQTIWVTGKNGFIAKYDEEYLDTIPSPFRGKVIKVNSIGDDYLIFSSLNEGFYLYNIATNKGELFDYKEFNCSKIQNVVVLGEYILFCDKKGVAVLKNLSNGKLELIQNFTEIRYVNDATLINKTDLYLSTEKRGVVNARIENGKIRLRSGGFKIGKEFGSTIKGMTIDKDQNIWLSTFGKGSIQLLTVKGDIINVKKHNAINGLPSDFINKVLQDYEGNIWFATYGGGIAYKPSDYLKPLNLNIVGNRLISDVENVDGVLYVACNNILYNLSRGDFDTICVLDNSHRISSISVHDTLGVYIGTKENGVYEYQFDTKEINRINYSKESLAKKVNDVIFGDGVLWISTYDGLYKYNNENDISVFNSSNGLRHNLIHEVLLRSNGELVVGTKNNRLFFLKDTLITEVKLPSPNPNINISTVIEAGDMVVVGTLGEGLFVVYKDSIKHFSIQDGLSSNYIYALETVKDKNHILVVHEGSLSSIDIKSGQIDKFDEKIEFQRLFQLRSITKSTNNEIQIGTDHGVVQFSPDDYYGKEIEPKLGFNKIWVNDEILQPDEKGFIRLPYDKHKLVLDYKGISFGNKSEIDYQYFLEGFDEEWHKGDRNDYAVYKSLGPGTYNFKIKACVGDVCEEKVSTIKIVIDSPIWRKAWFVILASLCIIMFIVGAFWLQEQSNVRRKKILEFNIQLKTKELNLKNDQILSSISYAKRIQDVIIPKSLEKDGTFSFDFFVYEKPKDIVGGDFVWFKSIEDKQAIAVCDCTGHGVPGGFMTILSVDMLNAIFAKNEFIAPFEVLNQMDLTVKKRLYENSEGGINDGLDMGMVIIDEPNNIITYSGANRPIVVCYKSGETKLLKGTRKSIGDLYSKKEFSDIVLNIDEIKGFYIFSDGVIDQFGGPDQKKFSTKRLVGLISEMCNDPIEKQKEILSESMSLWMASADFQTDDISFLGVKFS